MFLTLLLACSGSPSEPAVVPVTMAQVDAEADRLAAQKPPSDDSLMLLIQQGQKQYGGPFTLVVAGTDSLGPGVDNWRTCAKLTPEQIGVPASAPYVFYDQDAQPCTPTSSGFVMNMIVAGPTGFEKAIHDPTYRNERMTVMIAAIASIPAE